MFMPVHPTAQVFFGIVEMERHQQVQADHLVELGKGTLVPLRGAQVVARSKGVFGVKAHAQPFWRFRCVDYLPYLLEAVAEVRPLAGGDLEDKRGSIARARLLPRIDGVGDSL